MAWDDTNSAWSGNDSQSNNTNLFGGGNNNYNNNSNFNPADHIKVDENTIIREGYVEKRGEGALAGYKKRYIVVSANKSIAYYTHRDKKDIRGTINIAPNNLASKNDPISNACRAMKKEKYGWKIECSKRVWKFRSDNDNETKAWIGAIRASIDGSYLANLRKQTQEDLAAHLRALTAESRAQRRKQRDHKLVKSEEQYQQFLSTLVKKIYVPLKTNAKDLKISEESVEQVFGYIRKIEQFYVSFLDSIHHQDGVLDAFVLFEKCAPIYEQYLKHYNSILDVLASWRSTEFREFMTLRLKDSNITAGLDAYLENNVFDPHLSLPWLVYYPFGRILKYYRYLQDLFRIAYDDDTDIGDKKLAMVMKSVKKVYDLVFDS